MRVTKLGHACVRLETETAVVVVDPGGFTSPDAVDGASGVLVTHRHPDHLDVDNLRRAQCEIFANQQVADSIREQDADVAGSVTVVSAGDHVAVAGVAVTVHGEQHAEIHRDIPIIANTGFLVEADGLSVFHPGDALTVPPSAVDVLCVPVHAPWLRAALAIDYARAVGAERSLAIHDGLLNDNGRTVTQRVYEQLLDGHTRFSWLDVGDQLA